MRPVLLPVLRPVLLPVLRPVLWPVLWSAASDSAAVCEVCDSAAACPARKLQSAGRIGFHVCLRAFYIHTHAARK